MLNCNHNEAQRALVGTWPSIEIFAALDRGYRILDVFEIWHFEEESHYSNRDKTLFGGYVDVVIKLKTESSGLRDDCTNPDEFIDKFYKAEGVRLDMLKKNKGMRALCKSILNKNLGKLSQRDNLTKTEYITKPADFFVLISDQLKTVKHVNICREEMLLVDREDSTAFVQPNGNSNVVVGAYVTSQARLHLYKLLEALGRRVLYFDTDSCIYVHKPDEWNPKIINNMLGEWVDELPQAKITKFVGLGPKNYAYEYVKNNGKMKLTLKVKGLTQDYSTSKMISFDKMLRWLKEERDTFNIKVEYRNRIRKNRDRQVYSDKQTKIYKFVYDKRMIVEGTPFTLPYC